MTLPDRIAATMGRLLPSWRDCPGVVAVSGGADSVALLRLLTTPPRVGEGAGGWGSRLNLAHANHGLRGDESDADEAFVIELAKRLNVEVRAERVPVPAGNLEGEARTARYAFLHRVAADHGAGWIATAHTLDDQAETVLHRLIRGTGIDGLRGIHGKSPGAAAPGLCVVRPLLEVRRAELRDYLVSINQPFSEDSSNADPRFTRNRIRRELLPLLETFNPSIADVLHRLARQAADLHDDGEAEAVRLLNDVELPRAGAVLVFDAAKLEASTEPQRRAVLRFAWRREGWPQAGMTFAHWQRLATLATCDFPDGVRSRRIGGVFQLQGDCRRPAF